MTETPSYKQIAKSVNEAIASIKFYPGTKVVVKSDETITVWVTETGDESTPYVVNTDEDMRTNYDDLIDSMNPAVTIKLGHSTVTYDVSRLFREGDEDTYDVEFSNYCDTYDVELEMPLDVYLADDTDTTAWLNTQQDVTGVRSDG